ncbi:MAG TPA: replication-relaxation family protein [Anaeromyxobacteraceae bacterium]|nr:replication-relaxation family protein [Anaeromyxobacteraceae bacterium]
MARYASTEQVHRLLGGSLGPESVVRWLARLADPPSRPRREALLRRLAFRRADGRPVTVWTLGVRGEALAAELAGGAPQSHPRRVGHAFLEHALLLNGVLLDLLALAAAPGDLAALPFAWVSEGRGSLAFRTFRRPLGFAAPASLRPDAVLSVPGRRRRVFLEAETGTQSIASARSAGVLSKVDRYASYVLGAAGNGKTFYLRDFPDRYLPRLAILVRSAERRDRVRRAVADRLGAIPPSQFRVAVLTFAEAGAALARYLPAPHVAPVRSRAPPLVGVDAVLRAERACTRLGVALRAERDAALASGDSGLVPVSPRLRGEARALGRLLEEFCEPDRGDEDGTNG